MENLANVSVNYGCSPRGIISWKYYNQIKKKAMEQEFSWSGLLISLSIAFFVVIACAQGLKTVYQTMETSQQHLQFMSEKVYRLEVKNKPTLPANYWQSNYLNPNQQSIMEKLPDNIKYII